MRTLAIISLDTAAANASIKNGEVGQAIASALDAIKPEAAYFGLKDGKRTAFIVFDMQEPSDAVAIAEPWFQNLQAEVSFEPIMSLDDLRAGLGKISG